MSIISLTLQKYFVKISLQHRYNIENIDVMEKRKKKKTQSTHAKGI